MNQSDRACPSQLGDRIRFVLSAGRTGTVSVSSYLDRLSPSSLTAAHEPWPARWEHVIGNGVRAGLPLRSVSMSMFSRLRAARVARLCHGGLLIEVNPHLASMLELIPELVRPLHVVHIVRHPVDWTQSITSFGASGWRRYLVDFVPFARPRPSPLPEGWSSLTRAEKMLWRWRATNESIEQLARVAATYERLKYEDLFGESRDSRMQALHALHRGLNLSLSPNLDLLEDVGRTNAGPRAVARGIRLAPSAVNQICGELARRYGYG